MSKKSYDGASVSFFVVCALGTGAALGNADRLIEKFSSKTEAVASNFNDNAWRKEPHIAQQEAFQDDVQTFAETVRKSLPPRDKALEQHRAITATCNKFHKAVNYGTNYAFYNSSQQKARDCLTVVERVAIETKTKYDTKFTELVDRYTRNDYPEGVQPPVFALSK